METAEEQQQGARLMLSCDNCRRKKIRCNGGKPLCASCQRNGAPCRYSPVGPRRKPRRSTAQTAKAKATVGSDSESAGETADGGGHRAKRRASSLQISDNDRGASAGVSSVSHLMLERLREAEAAVVDPGRPTPVDASATGMQSRLPVMEMLRLQTQISGLVDQLRNLTIHHASGMTPVSVGSPVAGSRSPPTTGDAPRSTDHNLAEAVSPDRAFATLNNHSPHDRRQSRVGSDPPPLGPSVQQASDVGSSKAGTEDASETKQHMRGLNISRDLINHLISVYFKYGHPSETGMHPIELYRDRLERAQVSEPFLLSVLAVASRFSDDARVTREPAYLAGYDFFERVTRSLMMDVLERDCVENMLTLNNLAVYAVGLPVANRGWYFSGMAMRMATQMSLQKVDAPGRMPGASMMSGPGIESARRAFWTTLLLEALASFASGEPPPITIQDIHVAEPFDDPTMLSDDPVGTMSSDAAGGGGDQPSSKETAAPRRSAQPNVCAYIAQLAMLLVRVARLNGNRHPESAQFSPEYASLHTEMVAWYHGLPDAMQIRPSTARDEISRDPQLFGAKMFVHCHYHAAIIALHQPRVDLVRVESTGFQDTEPGGSSSGGVAPLRPRYSNHRSTGPPGNQSWRQLAQQQCLTAACTMTELLTLARTLDVRHHIVTFGFAVFMAGVVHVGAVAYTPRESTERQYSINCVKEHVRCLDRLGKYFAFHYIMAKHIRAQLQTIQIADERRLRKEANTAMSSPAPPPMGGAGIHHAADGGWSAFDLSAALGIGTPQQLSMFQQQGTSSSSSSAPADFAAIQAMDMSGLDAALFGSDANNWLTASPLFAQQPASSLGDGLSGTPVATVASQHPAIPQSSMDAFLGLLSSSGSPSSQQQLPGGGGASLASSMMMSGMAGLAGLSSLGQLFSAGDFNSPSGGPLYPEKLLSTSLLAPSPKHPASAQQQQQQQISSPELPVPSNALTQPINPSIASSSDPTAPLRFTSPGGLPQFGSLPPYSPL